MSVLLAEIIAYLFFISIFSFTLCGLDKRKAEQRKRRISENKLLLSVLAGGTIGFAMGMILFEHKRSKNSFMFKFISILIIQSLLIGYFIFFIE